MASIIFFGNYSSINEVFAVTSETVSFQGKIVRNDAGSEGINVDTGSSACIKVGADTCSFKASYYDDSVGTTLLGSETFSGVELGDNEGVFNLLFGTESFTSGAVSSFEGIFSGGYDDVHVKVEFAPDVNGTIFSENFGLMGMRATPYALNSRYLGGLDKDEFLQLGPSVAQIDNSGNTSIFVNNTGGGDLIDLQVGGVSKFVVDGSGNVGIGTGSPNSKLEVFGDISLTTNTLKWGTSGSEDVSLYRSSANLLSLGVDDSFKVSNTAGDSLSITSGAGAVFISAVQGTSTDWSYTTNVLGDIQKRYIVRADGSTLWGDGTNATDTNLFRNSSGVLRTNGSFVIDGALTVGLNETTNGTITFYSSGIGESDPYINANAFGGLFIQSPSGGMNIDGETINLRNADGSASRLYIDSIGDVGIGITAPDRELHLAGGSGGGIKLSDSTDINGHIIRTNSSATNNYGLVIENADGTDYATFGGAAGHSIMNANLGIGITSPSSTLEVAGNVELTNLYDNDTTNFFDGGCSSTETVTGISSTGAITCTSITGVPASSMLFSGITSATNTAAAMVVGTGASLDYTGSGTINASSLAGMTVTTGATANTIMSRDSNGHTNVNYLLSNYVSMWHASGTRNSDTIFYSSTDDFIRKNTADGMRTSLGLTAGGTGDIWVEKAGDTMTGALIVNSTGTFTSSLSSTTLDTGQGANELYDMDQNVLTSSSPVFSNININIGNGNGVCFWYNCTNYTISMGSDQADYGWVTDYSMHMNMGPTSARGFTWGTSKTAVTASLEATTGNFAIAGDIAVNGGNLYIGDDTEWRDNGVNIIYTPDSLDVDGYTYLDGLRMDSTLNLNAQHLDNIGILSFNESDNISIDANVSGLLFDGGDGTLDFLIYDNMIYSDTLSLGYNGSAQITTYDINEDLLINPNGTGDVIFDATGNVGIGIDPTQKFHVSGNSLVTGNTYIGATDTYFYRDGANRIATPDDFYVQASSGNTYLFSTNTYLGNSSGDYIRVRDNQLYGDDWFINYQANGNWGIGTTTPGYKLDVNGTSRFSDHMRIEAGKNISFYDHNGTYPTAEGGFVWDLNSDSAKIYAQQPAADQIDFVFKIQDNISSTDRFVYWIDSYTGETDDVYPLMMDGNKAVFNYPTVFGTGTSKNVDFYIMGNGQSSLANAYFFGDASTDSIGIGTTTTGSYKLNVNGTGYFSSLLTLNSGINVNSESITDFTGTGLSLTSGALNVNQASLNAEGFSTGLTSGSVIFSDGTNFAEDSSNFFWDDINNRLGLGTPLPLEVLDVEGRIFLANSTAPGTTTNRLYAIGGDLYWDGGLIGGGTRKITLEAEYDGAVLSADGSTNIGSIYADNAGSTNSWMNYYNWSSSETILNDYDVRVRFTLPSDFTSWDTNAIVVDYATQTISTADNQIDLSVYLDSSGTVDATDNDNISSSAGIWTTTTITSGSLTQCNAAGETCVLILRMFSKNDNDVKIGDITLNYNN